MATKSVFDHQKNLVPHFNTLKNVRSNTAALFGNIQEKNEVGAVEKIESFSSTLMATKSMVKCYFC